MEFETFEVWSEEQITDRKQTCVIINRPVICSGYLGKAVLDRSLLRDL
ncbi:hypothetical protein [Paenibacillus sp. DMB5]|nr:hypothetical protein [Paenibacillus sp. DMB5]